MTADNARDSNTDAPYINDLDTAGNEESPNAIMTDMPPKPAMVSSKVNRAVFKKVANETVE